MLKRNRESKLQYERWVAIQESLSKERHKCKNV